MNISNTPRKVVAYMRVACRDQLALEHQQAAVQQYADAHGYEIVSFISDNGISGLCNPQAVTRIVGEVQKHPCDTVVCLDPSRLSRNPLLLMNMLETLAQNDLCVEYVQPPLSTAGVSGESQALWRYIGDCSRKKIVK